MIKILAISASPVVESSTELILKRVAMSVRTHIQDSREVETSFVRLNELKFTPCQACGEAPTPEFCLYDDDLSELYIELAACDCLLFGSPVYFDSVSAQAKMFIDRCNCFRPPDFDNVDPQRDFIKVLTRKRPGAMVLVGGEHGWFEGARRVIAGFFKWVEVTNEGIIIYHSPDFTRSGVAGDDTAVMAEADRLGRRLAESVINSPC